MRKLLRKPLTWLLAAVFVLGSLAFTVWRFAQAQEPVPVILPTVQFTASSYTVTEGDSVTITVTLSDPSSQTVTVAYRVQVNDNGIVGEETGTIVFNPGETTKSAMFTILDDTCCQGNGTALVVLENPLGATLGSPSSMTVTVLDNDICP
jgi:cytoskeletal protein RodZ